MLSGYALEVFGNISGKVVMEVPGMNDKEGRLSLTLLAEVDERMAAACQAGLQWEILSHKLGDEDRALESSNPH